MKNNEDTIELNNNGEIYLGSPMSIDQNSNSKLYNWKIENYEGQARECWLIKKKSPLSSTHLFFYIYYYLSFLKESPRVTIFGTN